MKQPKWFSSENPTWCRLATTMLLMLGIGTTISIGALQQGPDPNEGPWQNPAPLLECQARAAGTVCVEWPSPSAGLSHYCCVYPQDLGGDFSACQLYLGSRPLSDPDDPEPDDVAL